MADLEKLAADCLLDMAGKSMHWDKSVATLTALLRRVRDEALEEAVEDVERFADSEIEKQFTTVADVVASVRALKSQEPA